MIIPNLIIVVFGLFFPCSEVDHIIPVFVLSYYDCSYIASLIMYLDHILHSEVVEVEDNFIWSFTTQSDYQVAKQLHAIEGHE